MPHVYRYRLRDVKECIFVLLAPLQILRFNQMIDPFLDHVDLRYEMALHSFDDSSFQVLVGHLFPRFHDTYDGRLQVMQPVSLDISLRTLRLFRL